MSFRKDKTTAAQTAANATGAIVGAALAAKAIEGGDILGLTTEVFDLLFDKLGPVVDADNKMFAEQEASAPAAPRSSGGSSYSKSSNGGKKSYGGGGGKGPTLASSKSLPLTWGAFEGVKLADLPGISASDAADNYEYGDGERGGTEYLAWLASDSNNNDYVRSRAQLVAADLGIEVE